MRPLRADTGRDGMDCVKSRIFLQDGRSELLHISGTIRFGEVMRICARAWWKFSLFNKNY
ncbi:hypothetical protein KL86DES1_22197 [uncultured Desulfovibrio sp.]|uniref:Uncharacterized protein n=1 Tax=uncultured Desulfovibrio sp. TaxID=167968 RepID=A0A212LBA3_9BACT|nr:hypothetical protein KL86DES1_22197 [uncultured Desulfovibrio sp.]